MGRRRGKSSQDGTIFLVVFVALVAAVGAVYRFIVYHAQAIAAFALVCSGILLLAYVVSRFRSGKAGLPQRTPEPRLVASAGRASDRPSRASDKPAVWIPASERVKVGSTEIGGGLFYFGAWIPLDGAGTDQYAINPTLPASSRTADVEGQTMSYWPSYARMSPDARRAFLDWMAGGRRHPAYGIGHVFMFFYGLEHRVFVERGDDASLLIREVERLLAVYGSNNSFRTYATNFLALATIASGMRPELPALSPERAAGPEMDVATQVHLGERLAQSPALSAEDALRWVLATPDTYLRTPAVRCFNEFVELWGLRFEQRFVGGLVIRPTAGISLRYRAASAAFEVEVRGPHERHGDISTVTEVLADLRTMIADCTDELDAFSRLVGRKPSARNSMAAAALLPADMQRSTTSGPIADFRERVETVMGSQGRGSSTAQVFFEMAGIDIPADGKIPATSADELGRALDTIGVAIEPDRRYGSTVPRADEQVFVFKAPNGGPVDPTRSPFRAMRAQVEVAVLAAAADGDASYEELQRAIARIRDDTDLSGVEQARLIAFAVTTFNSPPKQARVMRKLAETSQSERQAIADAAVSVIGGNPNVDASEVKFLERLHKSLGLPKENVYASLHRVTAAKSDEPVSISEEMRIPGIPIPKSEPSKAPPSSASRININAARLERTRRETEEVSVLLSGIFAEETVAVPPAATSQQVAAFEGLDGPHTELVELLELRGSMTRSEFERHAKEIRLLPDGAIERINDWSFDHFDEPLIEDGDEVVVSPHLRGRIAEMKEKAA
ncbi:TerB N-terminal domain-containing protein [Bradyrhizobium sp. AUGA SZCCT0431]|nr:TerB N-terminal domain-containing protein [Bradyrhizobium sp. AUGA SZCCT0431]